MIELKRISMALLVVASISGLVACAGTATVHGDGTATSNGIAIGDGNKILNPDTSLEF